MYPSYSLAAESYINAHMFNKLSQCSPCTGRLLALPVTLIGIATHLLATVACTVEAVAFLVINIISGIFCSKNRKQSFRDALICVVVVITSVSIGLVTVVMRLSILIALINPHRYYKSVSRKCLHEYCKSKLRINHKTVSTFEKFTHILTIFLELESQESPAEYARKFQDTYGGHRDKRFKPSIFRPEIKAECDKKEIFEKKYGITIIEETEKIVLKQEDIDAFELFQQYCFKGNRFIFDSEDDPFIEALRENFKINNT